jgi:hypothetical protein
MKYLIIVIILLMVFLKLPQTQEIPVLSDSESFIYAQEYSESDSGVIQYDAFLPAVAYPTAQFAISALVYRIIQCESDWNNDAINASSDAVGYGQFIPSTQKYVQEKWGIKLNFNDPQDNLYATQRLLEEEGCRPWRASASCHKCYE